MVEFLKIQRHQGFQPVGVGGWDFGQRLLNRGPKRREIRMIFPVNALSLREPPQPFDQVQVRRIGRQERQPNPQLRRQPLHDRVALILRVVQHQRDRTHQFLRRDFPQQFAHRLGVHHGRIRNGHQFPCDRIPRPQDVEPLTARRGPNVHTRDRPQTAQEGAEDEVRGVDEVHVAIAFLSRIERRLKLRFQEFALNFDLLGQRLLGARVPPGCVATGSPANRGRCGFGSGRDADR